MELMKPGESQLPASLEDLATFVLVGREKLTAVRAGIRAIEKLGLAKDVREQKKGEAQMLAEALLDAEVRIGEILERMPKASGKHENRGNQYQSGKSNSAVTFSTNEKTKEAAAQELGFGKTQVHRFETLARNKDLVEQVKQEARENDDLPTRTAVLQAVKNQALESKIKEREDYIKKQAEEIAAGNLPELDGLFDVVSIDPPWPYGREYNPETSRVANPYPEMEIEEIAAIELPLMEDGVVFLWTTHQFLPDAFKLAEIWGLTYKATMVWDKEKMGMGSWLRMQCEFCLLCVKGNPHWKNTLHRDILRESRREHSRKPDIFFEMINQLCHGRKLEYFAREARPGWQVFGNEINKF